MSSVTTSTTERSRSPSAAAAAAADADAGGEPTRRFGVPGARSRAVSKCATTAAASSSAPRASRSSGATFA